MRPSFHMIKAGMATVISLWMAVLACFMGCTQPVLASSQAIVEASANQRNSVNHSQSEQMADMENCHHSGSNSPAPSNDRKPPSNGAVSCCPLEITVIQKWNTPTPEIDSAQVIARPSDFHFHLHLARLSGPVELSQSISHTGRDTLLETHLLRI